MQRNGCAISKVYGEIYGIDLFIMTSTSMYVACFSAIVQCYFLQKYEASNCYSLLYLTP